MTELNEETILDDQGTGLGDTGTDDTGAGAGDEGIPEDLQAVGITDPEVYGALKQQGVTSAKELALWQRGRQVGFHQGTEDAKGKTPKVVPDDEPPPKRDDTDYVEPLRENWRSMIGAEIRKAKKEVEAGKLSKEDFFEEALTRATVKVLEKQLGDSAAITQRMLDDKAGQIFQLEEEDRALRFFKDNPQYKPFEKRIRTQVDKGVPIGEVLDLIDEAVSAGVGAYGGRRQPTREDQETAQLRRARANVEGYVETPTPRGGATSGTNADRAVLNKIADSVVEARRKYGSESDEYKKALTKWNRTRSG